MAGLLSSKTAGFDVPRKDLQNNIIVIYLIIKSRKNRPTIADRHYYNHLLN
jgi:hypothetical protein